MAAKYAGLKDHLDNFKGINWRHKNVRRTLIFLLPPIVMALIIAFLFQNTNESDNREDL
jgi:hypothetical protein